MSKFTPTEVLYFVPGKGQRVKTCRTEAQLSALHDKVSDDGGEFLGYRDVETTVAQGVA